MNRNPILKLSSESKIVLFLKDNMLFFVLLLIIAAGAIVSDHFFTIENFINLLRQISIIGILSCSLTYCIILANIDLSFGAVTSMCAVIAILLQPVNWIFASIIGILAGVMVGILNGLIKGRLNANPIITTLGMTAIIQAVSVQISKGGQILGGDINSPFSFIGKGYIWIIPFPVIIFAVVVYIFQTILAKLALGKYMYAVGNNEEIAWVMGVRVKNVRLFAFTMMGLCGGLAGIVQASRLVGAKANVGVSLLLFDAITAVILGGTSLTGGRGNVVKTMVGVLIIGVIGNILILKGVGFGGQQLVKGAILILAVVMNVYLGKGGAEIEKG